MMCFFTCCVKCCCLASYTLKQKLNISLSYPNKHDIRRTMTVFAVTERQRDAIDKPQRNILWAGIIRPMNDHEQTDRIHLRAAPPGTRRHRRGPAAPLAPGVFVCFFHALECPLFAWKHLIKNTYVPKTVVRPSRVYLTTDSPIWLNAVWRRGLRRPSTAGQKWSPWRWVITAVNASSVLLAPVWLRPATMTDKLSMHSLNRQSHRPTLCSI